MNTYKKYKTSIDKEQLRHAKYNSTPEQRMNWLVDAISFVREVQKNGKPRKMK